MSFVLINIYKRTLSPIIGNNCRFTPTCSEYTKQAIEKYGVIKGVFKGIKRLSKCNNRGDGMRGGFDYP